MLPLLVLLIYENLTFEEVLFTLFSNEIVIVILIAKEDLLQNKW